MKRPSKKGPKPMTSRDFCYWLQGLFELGSDKTLDARQTDLVKRHLAMVFLHEIDPSAGDARKQAKLNNAHQTPAVTPYPGPPVYRC